MSPSRVSSGDPDLERILLRLEEIRAEVVEAGVASEDELRQVDPRYRASALNLLHYLALRRRDLRPLQLELAALGLSSLGRAEPGVLAALDAVLDMLRRATGRPSESTTADRLAQFSRGHRLLQEHTNTLLGPADRGRPVRIMVTMPSEAAEQHQLVHDLLSQGMDCMRINCAHDDRAAWTRMIEHLRRAEEEVGRGCRVVMDLTGPKLRTGPIEPGPAVVRVRPERDAYGRVVAPGRVWLTSNESPHPPPSPAAASLPMPPAWLDRLRPGDAVTLRDARDARRELEVIEVTERGIWAETSKTAYVTTGTVLRRDPGRGQGKRSARVGVLPPGEQTITLRPNDVLLITRDEAPGRPASHDSAGRLLTPATIGCTVPSVFEQVQAGEPIWFDDGKIGGVVERVDPTAVLVRVTRARPKGARLRADKGINLPESRLEIDALTPKDLEDLTFIAEHADVVELSFANRDRDVELLERELTRLGPRRPGIVLKIETRRRFENLPEMLLAAMRWPCSGVMIARGDLAVETGFERMAEVQEEILWISEAAHVPVIWATQVLETLAREGAPSRAEITDAAMGHRAECVMLNKGPHVLSALRVLDDILRRMATHQTKKRAMLRELHLAHALLDQDEDDLDADGPEPAARISRSAR